MSSLELEKLNEALDKQRVRIAKLKKFKRYENIEMYDNFLNYVEQNPTRSYYPINKILTDSKSNSIDNVISIVEFFSAFLDIQYFYFNSDDGENILISRDSYIEAMELGEAPVDMMTGNHIEYYDHKNISFYCTLNTTEYGCDRND